MALPMDYSAAIMMDNELDATSGAFMSMNQLGRIVIDALLFILVLLIVCLIIYIVHKRRIQEGHPPYSNLYVIIPHVILIVIFAVLTQFLSYYMFSVPVARAVCAGMAIVCLLLLQIRALHRRKTAWNLVIMIFFLLFIPALVIFYRGLAATSYTNTNAFIYFLMMAVYTLIAVRAYHGPFRQR